MKRTFVLKNVAYATDTAGTVITSVSQSDKLAVGSVAVFIDDEVVTAASDIESASPDSYISFAVGYPSGVKRTPRVRIKQFRQHRLTPYLAPAAKVVTLTGVKDTIGEAILKLYNKSLQAVYSLDRLTISKTRKEGVTLPNFLATFVETADPNVIDAGFKKRNAIANIEAITGSDPGLRITALSPDINLEIGRDGIFEDAVVTVTTEGTKGLGVAEDVAQDEKDTLGMFGDSGYELDEMFNRAINAVEGVEYDGITVSYDMYHTTPSSTHHSMQEELTLYGKVGGPGFDTVNSIISALAGSVIEEDGTEGGE